MKNHQRTLTIGLVIILLIPLLTGCWDRMDPENVAFIVAVGVDPGPKNDYLFTFAIAVPKPLGGSGQSSGGTPKKSMVVYTVEGSNIISAMLSSQGFVSRRLTLTHAKVFILGEELAKNGVMPVLSEVVRSRDFRRSFYVLTTHGPAETYIQNIKPTIETDISLWFELELDPNSMGALLPTDSRFHNFITDMEKPGTGAVSIQTAPRPDIRNGTATFPAEDRDPETKQPLIGKQNAGKIHRVGETPVEFFGAAVYKGDAFKDFLTGTETKVLNMLRGEFRRTIWEFRDPADSKLNLSIDMKGQTSAVMKVQRRRNHIFVKFLIAMEGDLISVQSKVDYTNPKNRKKLEQSIQKEIKNLSNQLLNKTIHKWQVDCFYIGNRVKSSFSTMKEWEDYQWKNHVKDIDYTVDITFKMRGHGDQVGPATKGD